MCELTEEEQACIDEVYGTETKPVKPLIDIENIEINFDRITNYNHDWIISSASYFEKRLIKAGAIPNRDYTLLDLFKLAIESKKIDAFDNIKDEIERI